MDSESSVKHATAGAIVPVIIRCLRERMGRGPEGYRTYFVDDMIMVRLVKALTSAEYEQAKTAEGRKSIKDTRTRLIQDLRPSLEGLVEKATGARVVSIHNDVSTRTGEHMVVLVVDHKVTHPHEAQGSP